MARLVHLNALQALEAAIRLGTLRKAAEELGVTQAAIGQRIRALELFLDTPLLQRSAAGVTATPMASVIGPDLHRAFDLLDKVAETLNFDHDTAVRLRLDQDFLSLWLEPRLPAFRQAHPGIAVEFVTDDRPHHHQVDIEVLWGAQSDLPALWHDDLIPVMTLEILGIAQANRPEHLLEGVLLLHLADKPGSEPAGWPEWVAQHGLRPTGVGRGWRLTSLSDGVSTALGGAGVLLAPSRLVQDLLDRQVLRTLTEPMLRLSTRNAFRLNMPPKSATRRPAVLFRDWLLTAARDFAVD